jgi:hypothetical protein
MSLDQLELENPINKRKPAKGRQQAQGRHLASVALEIGISLDEHY